MPADDLTDVDLVPGEVADRSTAMPPRTLAVKIYEIAVSLPVIAIIAFALVQDPSVIHSTSQPTWQILVWIAAIAAVDLMPVPTTMSSVAFSLSFPIELSVAMLFPVPVAGLIALFGTADNREFRGELPFFKGLFIRTQVAAAALCESIVFKRLYPSWSHLTEKGNNDAIIWKIAVAVVAASIVGYVINILFVAVYNYFWLGESPMQFIREVHAGVFGEFLISYMGLALFSVLVITGYSRYGILSVGIFLAPLLFARQMFQRTHSLQQATDELAVKQAENEHQALHDSLTGMPGRMTFLQAKNTLGTFAKETGGAYYPVTFPGELPSVLGSINSLLRSQYSLAFNPGDVRDGKQHRIKVSVDVNGDGVNDDKEYVIQARQYYNAPKPDGSAAKQ